MTETAIGAALAKAGVNTGALELDAHAAKLLRANKNDPARVLAKFWADLVQSKPMRTALMLDYLTRIAARAPADPPAPPARQDRAEPAVKVHEHRRRSPEQKRAAREVFLAGANAVFEARQIDGRPIGDLSWRELRALVHENAINAASYLRLGTESTENAILLDKIVKHAVAASDAALVREIVKPEQLAAFIEQARREAPRLVERGMSLYARAVETGIEHAVS